MKKHLLFYILTFLAFFSCEKVVDMDLNEESPRVVIEGQVTNKPGPYTIRITQSGSYMGGDKFEKIVGANVKVYDNAGQSESLVEEEPGLYKTTNLEGVEGRVYHLEVEYDSEKYTASSSMPVKVPIDSLTLHHREEQLFNWPEYYINMHFTDPGHTRNYYYLKVYNNNMQGEPSPHFVVFDDLLFNGRSISDDIGFSDFEKGDTVHVELLSIDREAYEYYNNLNAILNNAGGNPFQGAPQNPTTNISGNALGFFGAYAIDKASILIDY
ncbi:DUF4249 domain-containing protein [Cytophagaceae bacterium ABcell3]|nr:DUF4249 domain-containing protein [Cytophagaceae bacterium ABcell3]